MRNPIRLIKQLKTLILIDLSPGPASAAAAVRPESVEHAHFDFHVANSIDSKTNASICLVDKFN